jgi:hypothetical protein
MRKNGKTYNRERKDKMKNTGKAVLGALAVLCLAALPAFAIYTQVNPNPGGEPNLYAVGGGGPGIMEAIYVNFQRVDDNIDQQWWHLVGPNAGLIAVYAGNGNNLYTANPVTGALDQANPIVAGQGGFMGRNPVNFVGFNPLNQPFVFADKTAGANGFTATGSWYSAPALNGVDGDHMVTFRVWGNDTSGNPIPANTYVIAFEDLSLRIADKDYQDLVVEVQGVAPVPDGGFTLSLLGAAIAGLTLVRRKLS